MRWRGGRFFPLIEWTQRRPKSKQFFLVPCLPGQA